MLKLRPLSNTSIQGKISVGTLPDGGSHSDRGADEASSLIVHRPRIHSKLNYYCMDYGSTLDLHSLWIDLQNKSQVVDPVHN